MHKCMHSACTSACMHNCRHACKHNGGIRFKQYIFSWMSMLVPPIVCRSLMYTIQCYTCGNLLQGVLERLVLAQNDEFHWWVPLPEVAPCTIMLEPLQNYWTYLEVFSNRNEMITTTGSTQRQVLYTILKYQSTLERILTENPVQSEHNISHITVHVNARDWW